MASSRQLPTSYNEHTYDSAGGKDYSVLATWESDTDTDLVAATNGEVLTCYSGVHNDLVVMAEATTSLLYFRVIRAVSGARGTPTSGVRFTKTSSTGASLIFDVRENYFGLYDIAGSAISTHLNDYAALLQVWISSHLKCVGCTAYNCSSTNGASAFANGFYLGGDNAILVNCYATAITGNAAYTSAILAYSSFGAQTVSVYNCTATNSSRGVLVYAQSGRTTICNLKNTIAQSNTISNISTDSVVGGIATLNPITNATSGVTFDVDGYHLYFNDRGALNKGTDLSGDETFSFNDDIDGTIIASNWAIGADWSLLAKTVGNNIGPSSRRTPTLYYESTYGDATRYYTSLAAWESDTDNDLTLQIAGEVLTCYDDGAPYSDSVTLTGATTSTDYYRLIRAANGQRGTPASGVRFVVSSAIASVWIFKIELENYSGCHNLYAKATSTLNNGYAVGFGTSSGPTGSFFVGCFSVAQATTGLDAYGMGYYLRHQSGTIQYLINSVAFDCRSGASSVIGAGVVIHSNGNGRGSSYIYNCTLIENQLAAVRTYAYTSNVYVTNTVLINTNTLVGGVYTSNYNATNNVQFGIDGYTLYKYDKQAINKGTDLSADGHFAFNDDINNATRTRWDVGCDFADIWDNTARALPVAFIESTYDSAGGKDYSLLSTWESDTDTDLVMSKIGYVLSCSARTHNDSLTISGATTNSSYFRVIRATGINKHNGTALGGVKFSVTNLAAPSVFIVQEDYVGLYDFIITGSLNYDVTVGGGLLTSVVNGYLRCVGLITYSISNNYGLFKGCGIRFNSTAESYAINCLSYKNEGDGFYSYSTGSANKFYNCTAYSNGGFGFEGSIGQTHTVKNCIAQSNTAGSFSGGTWAQTACVTTGVSFVSVATDNYHLNPADTIAINQGTDLSTDIAFPFCDDIDGDIRPTGIGTWDIGVDEYVIPILGPINLKSYNTNLKSNIKSVNGNLIANVKSIN
ncbi:MAG: right-handed parallel beta-helix repeat-containing protein [Candidatus Saccharimonadales bacterium]